MKKKRPDADSMIYWLFNRDSYNDLEPNSPLSFEGQLPKKNKAEIPFETKGPHLGSRDVLLNPHNWVVYSPIYPKSSGVFHCSRWNYRSFWNLIPSLVGINMYMNSSKALD